MVGNYWDRMLSLIALQTSTSNYEAWFEDTKGEIVDDTLKVICANVFQRDWVKANYLELISSVSFAVTGKELMIDIQTE